MNPNLALLLDGEKLREFDDQRRRDLAAQWGRPPVPRRLNRAAPRSRLAGRLARVVRRPSARDGGRSGGVPAPAVEGC